MTAPTPALTPEPDNCNEVTLVGRVSGDPERRDLPSGDALVTLRVVVDRPPQKKAQKNAPKKPQTGTQKDAGTGATRGTAKRAVDVIDVACWTKRTQRTAGGLEAGDGVRVEGALRRRFFAAGGGRASRYEVEAVRLVRVSRAAAPPGR
jgi:single-strand DNA-binding protein